MADPLSITGSIVGVISLGITVTQGLYDYYTACRDRESDVALTTKKLSSALGILETLRRQLETRTVHDAETRRLLASIESRMKDCEDVIHELEDELAKLNEKSLKGSGRRKAYPFRQSTLQKLEENVDELFPSLTLALQLLQQKDMTKVQDDGEANNRLLQLLRADQVRYVIREWLKAPDATIDFNEAARKRHYGTGLWFVNGPVFEGWLTKPSSFLWLVGFAGCGKSVLSSTAIQYASRKRSGNPRIGIAFFYFTFSDESKQDTSAMLRALVLQLSSQLNSSILERLYDSYRSAYPPDRALMDAFHKLVRAFDHVYIVLDALDESPPGNKHRDAVLDTLADIRSWNESGIHLLVTSRDEVDIREGLEATPEFSVAMKNDSIDRDIASFISGHLRDNRRLRKWREHYDRIEKVLTTRSGGVFRWVECQLQELASCGQSEDLLDKCLESLPRTLGESYARMLCKVLPSHQDYARQLLAMLCCARRPLTDAELIDGMAVQLDDDPKYNPKRRLKTSDALQEICPGFIESYMGTDDYSPHYGATMVRIAHFSVREYLESEDILVRPDAAFFSVKQQDSDAIFASICMSIVLERGLEDPANVDEEGIPILSMALAHYAADYWPDHYRGGHSNPKTEMQIMKLFTSQEGFFESWVTICDHDLDRRGYIHLYPYATPLPLHYASLLGLTLIAKGQTNLIQLLIDNGADVNAVSERFNTSTALQAACKYGHIDVVAQLIENGADVNEQGTIRKTPLSFASEWNHEDIVRLLIRENANLSTEWEQELAYASGSGHKNIVQLLLEAGAGLNVNKDHHETALQAASGSGHEDIVQMLIEANADVNATGNGGGTALFYAIKSNPVTHGGTFEVVDHVHRENIVRMLIQNGADVNERASNRDYETALQAAADEGCEGIARLLIEAGAEVNALSRHGEGEHMLPRSSQHDIKNGTPLEYVYGPALQRAARGGHRNIIQLLIDHGANIDASDVDLGTALQVAAWQGYESVVQLLIDHGADIHMSGTDLGTALQAAARRGHRGLVELLINHGIDINAPAGAFGTTLQAALCGGDEETIQVLIDHGADFNLPENELARTLNTAAGGGYENSVRRLLDHGVDVNAADTHDGTALERAAHEGHERVVQLLIGQGADVNAIGSFGRTQPLHAAAGMGHLEITRLLIDHGADINGANAEDGPALMAAARGRHEEIVQLLIDHGADVNTTSMRWGTALQVAAHSGREKIVQLLIDHGADINLSGGRYGTALQAATIKNHGNIARLLVKNGADQSSSMPEKRRPWIAVCLR